MNEIAEILGEDKVRNVDLSIISEAVGYQLRRAQLFALADFMESFEADGLRPADFSVLVLISANPGLMQSDIAEALGIQRANFVAIIDGLEKRGLAERRKSLSDRRVQSLFLTRSGRRFLSEMKTKWRAHEDRMIAKLGGPEARDQLVSLLHRLSGS